MPEMAAMVESVDLAVLELEAGALAAALWAEASTPKTTRHLLMAQLSPETVLGAGAAVAAPVREETVAVAAPVATAAMQLVVSLFLQLYPSGQP
jgi:hypothetical protein